MINNNGNNLVNLKNNKNELSSLVNNRNIIKEQNKMMMSVKNNLINADEIEQKKNETVLSVVKREKLENEAEFKGSTSHRGILLPIHLANIFSKRKINGSDSSISLEIDLKNATIELDLACNNNNDEFKKKRKNNLSMPR